MQINVSVCFTLHARVFIFTFTSLKFYKIHYWFPYQTVVWLLLFFISINFLLLYNVYMFDLSICLLGYIENNRECMNVAKCTYACWNAFYIFTGSEPLTHTSCNLLHTNMVIMMQFLSEFSPSLLLLMYEY